MKNTFITILCLFLFSVAQAQIETKIIGKWKVTKVETSKSKLNKDEEKQLKSLQKAGLEFTADHRAKFKQILSKYNIPNAYWEYNKEKDVIILSKWDDRNHTYMRLWYDENEDGTLTFYLDGTPFELIVERE